MDIPYELLPVLGPFGIVILLLGGLWRALSTGALVPRTSVDQLLAVMEARLATKDEIAAVHRDTAKAEREARITEAQANAELLDTARIVSDGIAALRAVAERGGDE